MEMHIPLCVAAAAVVGTRAVEATATVCGLRCLRRRAWSPKMCAGEATTLYLFDFCVVCVFFLE